MSSISVNTRVLRSVLADLQALAPKGQKTLPVRLSLQNEKLKFIVRGTCSYTTSISVDCNEVADVVVGYTDILDFLPKEGCVTLDMSSDSGVKIESNMAQTFLSPAYSTVEDINLGNIQYKEFENSSLVTAFHTLSKTGLDNLYKKTPPIEVFGKVAILKHPNIYIQMRAPEMKQSFSITQECANIVQSFAPKEYGQLASDTLVFKKHETYLTVPIRIITNGVTVKDVLPDKCFSMRIDLGDFGQKVNTLKKISVENVDIVLFESGIEVVGNIASMSVTMDLGNTKGEYVAAFTVPLPLFSICLKLLGDSLIEVLYKEGVLCLRTPTMAIVLRVRS